MAILDEVLPVGKDGVSEEIDASLTPEAAIILIKKRILASHASVAQR